MSKRRIMAMHQPNYIPWLGYFYKIAKADIFVYLDIVQFPRGKSFAARNRIKTPNGATYLTIPVSLPKGKEGKVLYTEVRFADEQWKKKHLKSF
ncbi:MAG: WbqC family protein, partial [Calditrichaeota bacterium]|nr:WbqC family protein [Calditrichota bacterium]